MDDSIEKTIELKAGVARVWRALTDHHEFGAWFGVRLDQPFAEGEMSTGQITTPGCDHLKWIARIEVIDDEKRFSLSWCPLADDPNVEIDFETEPKTLVEFRIEPISDSETKLHITESGFSALPEDRPRLDALRRNTGGWEFQCKNIAAHVEGKD